MVHHKDGSTGWLFFIFVFLILCWVCCSCVGVMTLRDLETGQNKQVFYNTKKKRNVGDTIYLKDDFGTSYYRIIKK